MERALLAVVGRKFKPNRAEFAGTFVHPAPGNSLEVACGLVILTNLLRFGACPFRYPAFVLLLPPMNITSVRRLLFAGALCALALTARAQIVELRATINAAQENNPANNSLASGTAQMFYDVEKNTFDLFVTINNMTNIATNSHIHEGAAGVNGSVVTGFGPETIPQYTRSGNTLTGVFRDVKHLGSPLKLVQGGAYFNIHTAAFPGGEVRGQLIPQPVRLYANLSVAQEAAANPTLNFSGLNDFGGAVITYDPAANRVNLRLSVFNFANTFSNSHFHEGIPGQNGSVVVGLGGPTASGYSTANGYIAGSFDMTYVNTAPTPVADPLKLLTGGAYLNFHSNAFGGGELRGQVMPSLEIPSSRFLNLAVRGFVGTGEQVLIAGIVVQGAEPVRALISAKGPSLSAFGITGTLANPRLALFDSAGRQIALNDDIGTVAAGSELAGLVGAPRNPVESALVVVLPPGNYTAIVSATAGTGVALLEVTDVR